MNVWVNAEEEAVVEVEVEVVVAVVEMMPSS
jgi:hypothetical protein